MSIDIINGSLNLKHSGQIQIVSPNDNTILQLLQEIRACACGKRFSYKVGPVTNKPKKTMLEISITNEQQVLVTLNPVTAAGHPAPVDGIPAWTVQSGNSTVVPAADGLSAQLVSEDNPGDTVFMVSADVDPGPGVTTISDLITLHVSHALAASLGLSEGAVTPKP